MIRKVFIADCMLAAVFIAGCDWIPNAQYKKQVNLTLPAGRAELFSAQTHNGNISVTGSETADCNLTAEIHVRADTEENAKKIAEQVKVSLLPEGNDITLNIEKPDIPKWFQISVNLKAILPKTMGLAIGTHNGNISLSGIAGRTEAVSYNGNIDYEGIAGDLKIGTHNGSIKVQCSRQSAAPSVISLTNYNGNISFIPPENFSAVVSGSTHNGSVSTNLPLTVTGRNNNTVSGTIGDGRDKLFLTTHNGSITIK
jgi:DUF4097 and DUF4098 domain-containing protein YvlB